MYYNNTPLFKKILFIFQHFTGLTLIGNPENTHARRAASLDSWFVRPLIGIKLLISSSVILQSLPFQHLNNGRCSTTFKPKERAISQIKIPIWWFCPTEYPFAAMTFFVSLMQRCQLFLPFIHDASTTTVISTSRQF